MKIWLSPEILNWKKGKLYSSPDWTYDISKPYHILDHTKKRFSEVNKKSDKENLVLGEIMYQLRKVVEHREKQMEMKFKFSQMPFLNSKHTYKQLKQIGITQPIFLEKLTTLRNRDTHQQRSPLGTEKKKIEELWEFAWYFLRTTDMFLKRYIHGMFLYSRDTEGIPVYNDDWLEFGPDEVILLNDILPDDVGVNIKIKGKKIPANLFSVDEKDDWMKLNLDLVQDSEHSISETSCMTPACLKWFQYIEASGGDIEGYFYSVKDLVIDDVAVCEDEFQHYAAWRSKQTLEGLAWTFGSGEDRGEYSMEKFISVYGEMENIDRIEANADIKSGREQRVKEFLASGKPVDFSANLIGSKDKLENIVRQYLALHIWY